MGVGAGGGGNILAAHPNLRCLFLGLWMFGGRGWRRARRASRAREGPQYVGFGRPPIPRRPARRVGPAGHTHREVEPLVVQGRKHEEDGQPSAVPPRGPRGPRRGPALRARVQTRTPPPPRRGEAGSAPGAELPPGAGLEAAPVPQRRARGVPAPPAPSPVPRPRHPRASTSTNTNFKLTREETRSGEGGGGRARGEEEEGGGPG